MDQRVREVLQRLDRDWRVPPRMPELAASVGLSPSRLEQLFRAHAKMTIRAYMTRRRLRTAARMLRSSHERVSTIAFTVGFNDTSNFNHAFKRLFGKSPLEYRRAEQAARLR
jgi:AraC family transcriptional regulator of arabinose operon